MVKDMAKISILCKSIVSEGKELISNWPIRFQETHGFSFLIGQFDINFFFTDNGLAKHNSTSSDQEELIYQK